MLDCAKRYLGSTSRTKAHIAGIIVLVSSLLISSIPCAATTVVVIRGDDSIVIGADSNVSSFNPESGRGEFQGCKILRVGDFFIAIAGIFGRGGPSGFNAYSLAQQVAAKDKTVIDIGNDFEKLVRKPYLDTLRDFYKFNPQAFEKNCKNKECLQFLVADFTVGRPSYALRRFEPKLSGGRVMTQVLPNRDCPGTCPLPNSAIVFGDNVEAMRVLKSTPNFWSSQGTIGGINTLIGIESTAHPQDVGGGTTILIIDKNGPRWANGYQGTCPNL